MVDIISTEEGFDSLKPIWEKLEQNANMKIMQTFLWQRFSWKLLQNIAGNALWILKWSQDGKDDVVIFPFYIDRNGTLRWIFDEHCDSCDAVYSSCKLNRHWVYKEVSDIIMAERRIKSIWLQKMEGGSEALNYFGVFLQGASVYKDHASAYICVNHPGDFISDQDHLRSDGRKHLRKLLKQGESYQYALLSFNHGDAFPRDEIVFLRDYMIRSGMRKRGFLSSEMIDFVETIYNAGCCEIPLFKRNGSPISLEFRLLKGTYSLDWIYLTMNPKTGTEINVRYCVDRAKDIAGIIDFGVGVYEYKILTTRPMVKVTCSIVLGKTVLKHLRCILRLNIRMIKDFAKGVLLKK